MKARVYVVRHGKQRAEMADCCWKCGVWAVTVLPTLDGDGWAEWEKDSAWVVTHLPTGFRASRGGGRALQEKLAARLVEWAGGDFGNTMKFGKAEDATAYAVVRHTWERVMAGEVTP